MTWIPPSRDRQLPNPVPSWRARGWPLALALWGLLACPIAAAAGPAAAAAADPSQPSGPFKAPYLPASEADVLQDVPSTRDPAVAEIRRLRGQRAAAPQNLPAALALADAYVDYGRRVGDAHYAGYAEAVIAPWIAAARPPAGALVTQATLLQYRHQFAEARAALNRALEADPRHGQAWLTLATLDMVQGNYEAARKDCSAVLSNAGLSLGLACSGNLGSYTGRARQALALLRQVEAAGDKLPASHQAWVQGLLAETAERLGDWPGAESHYLNALKLQPQDNFLLVAYADFLLDRARPREVLPLLADHAQSDTAFLRLALAQAALHGADAGRYAWIMAARFEALLQRGSDFFGREQARFALQLQHDPQAALDMARRNWHVQREPWDARLLLEAALAAHQPAAAAETLEFLKNSKLEDPIIEPLARELRAQLNRVTGTGK